MGTRTPGKSSAAIDVREQGSLLRALFDMSFSRFLTLELIKLMYVATIIIVIVATVSSILFAFSNSSDDQTQIIHCIASWFYSCGWWLRQPQPSISLL